VGIDAASDRAVVSIRDQGQGIPKEEQLGLFNPFHTTSIRPTTGETSTGLGLFIARRIVEEHGGRIWLESEPGAGSVFSFSLDRVRPAPRHAAQKKEPPSHTRNIA
jgi:signal transduction histidine kinase